MLKIEVTEAKSENVSGTGKQSGRPFSFNKQVIYVHNGSGIYPEKSEIILEDSQPPHAVGVYGLADNSIYVDRNGRLAVSPVLVPWIEKASK